MIRQEFEKIEKYMKSCMAKSKYDVEHPYRVLYMALEIAKYERNIDKDVLIASCLLHDIGKDQESRSNGVCHAKVGAKMARFFLFSNGWSRQKVDHVVQCIETHRYTSKQKPSTIEAKVLFDSDKIDSIGAIGISNILMIRGKKDIPLYNLYENGEIIQDKRIDDDSFINVYLSRLKDLHKFIYTDYGKKIAKERYHTTKIFYDKLLSELNFEYRNGIIEMKRIFGEKISEKGKNNYLWIENYLIQKQGVQKDYKANWEWTRFLINDDMFAILCKDTEGNSVLNIKTSLEVTDYLRKKYSEVKECIYLNRLYWNSIRLDGDISNSDMKKIIDKSYSFQLGIFRNKTNKG